MAAKKIFDVNWEDDDGAQGYYVKMTKAQADKFLRWLLAAQKDGKLKNPTVGAIEGGWLLTPKQLMSELKERY